MQEFSVLYCTLIMRTSNKMTDFLSIETARLVGIALSFIGMVKIPAAIISYLLVIVSRRWALAICLLAAGVTLFAVPWINEG